MIRHKISEAQKDRAWRTSAVQFNATRPMNSYYDQKDIKLLQLCAGHMELMDYTYVTNPFGLKDRKYTQYPAKLRNFDFISPLFQRLSALYSERVNEPIVYTKNSNFDSEISEYQTGLIQESLQQRFINGLIRSGRFDPALAAQQQEEPPMSEEVIKQKSSSIKDLVTIEGQHVINYVVDRQQVVMKQREAWQSFTKINKCLTFKDVRNDEVVYHTVPNVHAQYYGNTNTRFLEDAEVVSVRYRLTMPEVLEIFQAIFEEDEYKKEYGNILDQLESEAVSPGRLPGGLTGSDFFDTFAENGGFGDAWRQKNTSVNDTAVCDVVHTQFTSYKKVGKVYDVETDSVIEVGEDYLGDDVYEWVWYPEVREGWLINDRYVIGGYPVPVQPVDPDNPYYVKKNYNGRIFMQGEVRQVTMAEMLAHYQEAYNVVKYKIQVTVNKNKDKLLLLPLGLLGHMKGGQGDGQTYYNGEVDEDGKLRAQFNPSQEIDNESAVAKSLYYADATQFLFIDETSENAALAAQMLKDVDLSLGNYIEYLIRYAAGIKQEAEEYIGFNRFMMGRTTTNDPVSNSQQGIYAGSMVVEEYFTQFEEFLATEYQGIIDRGRFAYTKGRKVGYVRSNTDVQVMEITERFANHVYGVFVKSGAKTKQVRDAMMQYTNELIQNGTPGSAVAKIHAGTMNYTEIVQTLEAAEENFRKHQLAMQQQQSDADMQRAQMEAEEKQKDRDVKIYDIEMKAGTALYSGLTQAQSFVGSSDNGQGLDVLQANAAKVLADISKTQVEFQKLKVASDNNKRDNATKRYAADKTLQVARANPG